MNTTLLERLRAFQVPPESPISAGHVIVARLEGIEFEEILKSPDFGFTRPHDAAFNKVMLKTTTRMLGDDTCGCFGFAEHLEMSILLETARVEQRWQEAASLQSYLTSVASCKLSLLLDMEAVFKCRLFSFGQPELAVAYFSWRQQEAPLDGLSRHCAFHLSKEDRTPAEVNAILDGLGPLEMEEILRQQGVEYADLPSWQRHGAGVYLTDDGQRVKVDTDLPKETEFGPFLQQFLQ